MLDPSLIAVYAEEIVRLQDEAALADPISACQPSFSLDDAYAISLEVLRRRERSGWRRVGRKIGFTNRTIYEQYGVYAPMFGYMFDRTLAYAGQQVPGNSSPAAATLSLDGLAQPLIEPEIVFKLLHRPPLTPDTAAMLDCIEWYAHGFEIVQCHFPGWRFSAADTVADGGLHGRYLVGPPRALDAGSRGDLVRALSEFRISLLCNAKPAAEGGGALVLGSPLSALAYLLEVLETLPDHPPLQPGELITTGTLTAALPVAPGETWSTGIEGLDLPGLTVSFV